MKVSGESSREIEYKHHAAQKLSISCLWAGLPVMSQGELLERNNTFSMGGGWFRTQRMKEMVEFSA